MTFPAFLKVEPFGEPAASGASGRSSEMIRLGYRTSDAKAVLAAIEIPLSVVRQSIPQEVSVRLSPDSAIIASLDLDGVDECKGIKTVSLVQLIEELVEPDHLSMEEIKASELQALLRGLENSIHLVRAAISTLMSS